MNSNHQGFEFKEAHFPECTPIDAYGNGGFRFAGMSHQGSILCLPSGIYNWNPRSHSDLTMESFEKVLQEANQIEVLLIGTGEKLVPLNNELRTIFREKRIMADTMSTGAAIRTYNVLLAENRAVATSLIAVE